MRDSVRKRAARVASVLIALSSALLAFTVVPAQDAETGEEWESTFQMTMTGEETFAMPPTTTRFCRPRNEEWNEPPVPDKSDCTMSDVERSANTMTWTLQCTKPPATGSGTMTFDGDSSYTGEMLMTTNEGSIVMKMSGRRTGACDLGAQQRQLSAMEAQGASAMAQSEKAMADNCAEAARQGQSFMFIGKMAYCKEPDQLSAFCAALSTEAGYRGAKENAALGVDLAKAATTCGVDAKKVHDDLCVKAFLSESLEFVGEECPEQAQVLAQRECAGRKYTQMAGSKYQGFCSRYAQAAMEQQEADKAAAEADPKDKTTSKVKKGLRGLLGK